MSGEFGRMSAQQGSASGGGEPSLEELIGSLFGGAAAVARAADVSSSPREQAEGSVEAVAAMIEYEAVEQQASVEPEALSIDLLNHDSWHDAPEGWLAEFERRIHGLAEHPRAFLFDGYPNVWRPDLVPLAQVALTVLRAVHGSVSFDPSGFLREALASFASEDSYPVLSAYPWCVDDRANWLGWFAAFHDPGPERVLAAQALLDVLDLIPPLDPLNERIAACRQVVAMLLSDEHREAFVSVGWRDVYELIEGIAEAVDWPRLSDLCRPLVRMFSPVDVIDQIGSAGTGPLRPPSATQVAALTLHEKARRTGRPQDIPDDLSEALGAGRAVQLAFAVEQEQLQQQAIAWIEETAARDEEHHLVRRWLAAAWELDLRTQWRDGETTFWPAFDYEGLHRMYVDAWLAARADAGAVPDAVLSDGSLPVPAFAVETPAEGAEPVAVHRGASRPGDVDAILAEIDAIVGQPRLKRQIRQLMAQAQVNAKKAELGLTGSRTAIHLLFTGPPGTGKTTVARLVGRLLHALGVLPTDAFVEVDRAKLISENIGGSEKSTEAAIERAMGGVLFVDEAYALAEGGGNDFGPQIVNTLLKALSDRRGDFVCIAAGYTARMQEFLDSNPGMRSRFTRTISFEPYEVDELVEIAASMACAGHNRLDAEAAELLRRRLQDEERSGGFAKETWGNAREMENVIEAATANRDLRIVETGSDGDRDSFVSLAAADVEAACDDLGIGRAGGARESVEDVLAELDRQIGQPQLKRQVRMLLADARAAEADGDGARPALPHLLFTGPPGTGKTTIARLLARLYRALGLLPGGHLVEVDESGLVAGYIGQTALKTTEKIDEAMGGVLLVDEAYALAKKTDGGFGAEAITTLLKRMEDDRGRFLVIAAGYPDEMDAFLRSNVGLKRRFPVRIEFTAYSADELARIADVMFDELRQRPTEDARLLLRQRLLAAERGGLFAERDWGSAGSVRNLVEEAIRLRNARVFGDPASAPGAQERVAVTAVDVAAACEALLGAAVGDSRESVEDVLAELDRQIGQPELKRQVQSLMAGVRMQQARAAHGIAASGASLEHLVFTGPPGTGKTTIARLLARLYRALGLLPRGHVVEVDEAGLVSEFVGGTAVKTTEKIDEAMGGVLFVDEAYTLAKKQGGFGPDHGREAIDTLLKRMEDDRGRFLVIAAGYPDQMRAFLASNPGLPSRFTQRIGFAPYTADELVRIAEGMARADQETISPEALEVLGARLAAAEGAGMLAERTWGNAREARNLVGESIRIRNLRIWSAPDARPTRAELTTIAASDMTSACEARGLRLG